MCFKLEVDTMEVLYIDGKMDRIGCHSGDWTIKGQTCGETWLWNCIVAVHSSLKYVNRNHENVLDMTLILVLYKIIYPILFFALNYLSFSLLCLHASLSSELCPLHRWRWKCYFHRCFKVPGQALCRCVCQSLYLALIASLGLNVFLAEPFQCACEHLLTTSSYYLPVP